MRKRPRLLSGLVIALSALVLPVPALARAPSEAAQVRAQLAGVRLPVIANEGQVDAQVAYYAPTFAGTLFVTQRGSSSTPPATYLGGSGSDEAPALAIHSATSDVYVAGITDSSNFPGTAGGAQPAIGGEIDAFVARMTFGLALLDPVLSIPTLSEWAMLDLIALVLMTGLVGLRRRRSAH
jgi:hypothetical protein